tara:strand:+ start:3182 stop:4024 length:843 start_codon:yes stop_codon:yes gene_type:complete
MIKRNLKKLIYRTFLLSKGIKKSDIIILATISKTGTHYIRFILSYYLSLCKQEKACANDLSIVDRIFPNSWHVHYFFRRKPIYSEYLSLIGFKDMPRSHFAYQKSFSGSKVIHTYRNPLDYFTILWATKFRFSIQSREKYLHPFDLVEDYLDDFCDQYLSMKQDNGNDIFRISFESLIKNPFVILKQILIWLGHVPNDKNLMNAVNTSNSILTAKVGASEKWQRDGSVACNEKEYDSFLNKLDELNSVGIWKDYFSNKEIKLIDSMLKERGISLYEFTLE